MARRQEAHMNPLSVLFFASLGTGRGMSASPIGFVDRKRLSRGDSLIGEREGSIPKGDNVRVCYIQYII